MKKIDLDGHVTFSNTILVKIESGKLHAELAVFPNPVKSSATIRYTVPANAKVSLAIYHQKGQMITTLFSKDKLSGTCQQALSGYSLAKGKYYVKLVVGNEIVSNSFRKE